MKMKRYLPLLFMVYMSLLGGNFVLYSSILSLRIFHQVLMTLLLLYWFVKHGLPNTPMLLPVGAMAAAVGLSVVNALDSRVALEMSWSWFINLGIFLMLIDWFRRGYGDHLFGGAFTSGGAVAGSTLLQAITIPEMRPTGIFAGVTTLTGGYSAAQLLPVMGWALSKRGKRRWLLMALGIGELLTILVNGSRGALLSAGVAAAVVALPLVARRLKLGGLIIPLLIAIPLGISLWSVQPAHASGDKLRLDLWRASGDMFQARPLTGVGAGLFGQVYRHLTLYPGRPDGDGIMGAHNLYLNIAAELGTVGLVAGAGMILMMTYLLTKTHWNLVKLSVLGALLGILAHMGVDNFPTQNYSLLVSLYVAFLIHERRWRWRTPKLLGKAVGMGLLVFCLVLLRFDQAQVQFERSLRSGSVAAAQEARRLDPDLFLYQLNIFRLQKGMWAARRVEPTLYAKTKLDLYALVSYGRKW